MPQHTGRAGRRRRTIAVLPGGAGEPYPKENRQLHRQILLTVWRSASWAGASVRRWTFIARNRIIAALSELTIVVQGKSRSGALDHLRTSRVRAGRSPRGRARIRSDVSQSQGPHGLLREGAVLIRDAQDVLDAVCGVGARAAVDHRGCRSQPASERAVLAAIRGGANTVAALSRAEVADGPVLALLAELELAGCMRRVAGGRIRRLIVLTNRTLDML